MSKEKEAQARAQQLAVLKKLRIVVRSAQRHSGWIEKQCGVNGAQLWIMQELATTPGLKVGEIAERLAIHQTTASNLLDALHKQAYLSKERDSLDQRVVRLTLSESGRALLEKAPKPAQGLLPGALMRMDEKAIAMLDKGLQGLLEGMDGLDEEQGMLPLPFTL